MVKTDVINLAEEFADAVRTKYDTCKIYLFGSQVRGNTHDESDIDIAVVLKDYDKRIDMLMELMRIRRKIDSRIEPHPFRESEFNSSHILVEQILKYGIEIIN